MATQLVYPFRLRQRNSERRRRRVKSYQGVAIRKHRGIGELKTDDMKAKGEREKRRREREIVLIYAGKRTRC